MFKRCGSLLLAAALAAATLSQSPRAQEPTLLSAPARVNLFAADSLAGWDEGAAPRGWTMERGVLRGDAQATPLVSSWTYGDFDAELAWAAAGRLELTLLSVPRAEPLGRLTWEATDAVRRARVVRRGAEVLVGWPEATEKRLELPADARVAFGWRVLSGTAAVHAFRVAEPAGEALFNGRDLSGWWTPGDLDSWAVEDGAIVCKNRNGNYLRTEKPYANFTLSLDYKITRGGNSGIGLRTPRPGWPSSDGMELQFLDQPAAARLDGSSNMAIYRNVEPLARHDRAHSQDWNHVLVKAEGRMISAWVNGELCQVVNTARAPELRWRQLTGWIGFQDHGATLHVRNLRLLEAPAGLGLDAWRQAGTVPPAAQLLDRVMNTAALTKLDDGMASAYFRARPTGSEETELCDLTGPGALTLLESTTGKGRVRCYFDGEERPRFDGPLAQLKNQAATVSEMAPTLYYLPFARRLRVTIADAAGSELLGEAVRFPSTTTVESAPPKEQALPRGWWAAVDYRHFQQGLGTLRDFDFLGRAASGAKTIPAGETVSLLRLNGPGRLEWLRLEADGSLLLRDDLWLRITVDGETEPAIFAPARYLFPGLAGGRNFRNFVVLQKGGFVNRLAMPYRNGLEITILNRGPKQAAGVGVSAAYEPGDPTSKESPQVRLRGRFFPAGETGPMTWTGRGRIVGLVCGETRLGDTRIGTLELDGRPEPAWDEASIAGLLGPEASAPQVSGSFAGHVGGLSWRHLLLAPLEFREQAGLRLSGAPPQGLLVLYYALAP